MSYIGTEYYKCKNFHSLAVLSAIFPGEPGFADFTEAKWWWQL